MKKQSNTQKNDSGLKKKRFGSSRGIRIATSFLFLIQQISIAPVSLLASGETQLELTSSGSVMASTPYAVNELIQEAPTQSLSETTSDFLSNTVSLETVSSTNDSTSTDSSSGVYLVGATPTSGTGKRDNKAPTISSVTTTNIKLDSAAISWVTNEPADTQVQYGTTSQYGTFTVLGTALVTNHSVTLSGLASNTLYHFRVLSKDAAGNLKISNDLTFTTLQLLVPDTTAPVISNITTANLTSNGITINWVTNEASNTQVEYGTTTNFGSLSTLNTSLVTNHSVSLANLSANTTYYYRVLSRDAAGNLTASQVLSVKTLVTVQTTDTTAPVISNVITSNLTSIGVTITWTTNEIADTQVEYGTTTSYGSLTTLYISMVTSHSVTLNPLIANTTYHYRVYSKDAAGKLTVSQDFTFTTAPYYTAPVISNLVVTNLADQNVTISWTTDLATHSTVSYGMTTDLDNFAVELKEGFSVTDHSVTLTGLAPNTTYYYQISNRYWNYSNYSALFTFITPPDTTAPIISNVITKNLAPTDVTINWLTHEASDTQVQFGTTTSYGSSTTLNTARVTDHSVALSNLLANTTYHYRVLSRDQVGNLTVSGDFTFTTPASLDITPQTDVTAPIISWVTTSTYGLAALGITIRWWTNEATDAQVEYGTTTNYGAISALDSRMLTGHAVYLSYLLQPNTTYHYRVLSRDLAGNLTVSGDFKFTTAPAPSDVIVISNVTTTGLSSSHLDIKWTTNVASMSQIQYGTTTNYGSKASDYYETLTTTNHSVYLNTLEPNTTYHFRVLSWDQAGNVTVSGDFTFTTLALLDVTAPAISDVATSYLSPTGITIHWTTNEASDTQVKYGTTSYGSSSTLNTAMVTSHSVILSNLLANTTYHFEVYSKDAAGNFQRYPSISDEFTFTTPALTDVTLPVISGVTTTNLMAFGIAIHWATNEASTTQVEYGTTTNFGTLSTLDASLATDHSVSLTNLQSSTTYYYRLLSRDQAGNLTASQIFSFKTSSPTTTWFDTNIFDPVIRTWGSQYFQDGLMDRSDMINLFGRVAETGLIGAAEFTDLNLIANTRTLFGSLDYVWQLTKDVVLGSVANAYYQFQTLGNLAVGSTAEQLQKLVNKWFLGLDHPLTEYDSESQTYAPYYQLTSPLFVNGATYTDIKQGGVGDCYFVASLAEVAWRNPDMIYDMFIENGDGTYTVRFYNGSQPVYITVDRYLTTKISSGYFSNELWVALAEKAYVQLSELGWSRGGFETLNWYGSISGGLISAALGHITGKATTLVTLSASSFDNFVSTYNAGSMMGFGSKSAPASSGIANVIAYHAYAVVGYDAVTQVISLFNPWGIYYGLLKLVWSQIVANFSTTDYTKASLDGLEPARQPIFTPWSIGHALMTPAFSQTQANLFDSFNHTTKKMEGFKPTKRSVKGGPRTLRFKQNPKKF